MKKFTREQMLGAFKCASNHREQLSKDEKCGCFSCVTIFRTEKIKDWTTDGEGTAYCPYCWTEAVIGESSGYPITMEFMEEMNEFWYEGQKSRGLWEFVR